MSLPIFKGFPHTTSILRITGIERYLDYHPIYKTIPDLIYAGKFIENHGGGIYLKWLNKKGGYDYWLFSNVFSLSKRTKSKGDIINNFTNRSTAKSYENNLGKVSNNTLNIYTKQKLKLISAISNIVDSPDVYLYTKDCGYEKYNAHYCDWIKVTTVDGTTGLYNSKNNTEELSLRIKMPEIKTQSLI